MTATADRRQMVSVDRQDGVAILRFDRGEKKNAFDQILIRQLTIAAREFESDHETRAIVLTGTPQAFSAGMDLGDEMWRREATDLERRELFYSGVRMCEAWERVPQLTIAAIECMAVGGGVALALACDWRVAGEDAFLYVPEVKLGINLQWGALPRLVTLVGPARAKRICLLCEKLPAARALQWGLLDAVSGSGGPVEWAVETAREVARRPVTTVRMVKEAINATANALHRVSAFADADQSQLSAGFESAEQARARFFSQD